MLQAACVAIAAQLLACSAAKGVALHWEERLNTKDARNAADSAKCVRNDHDELNPKLNRCVGNVGRHVKRHYC